VFNCGAKWAGDIKGKIKMYPKIYLEHIKG
jgi:hypothetical protein